jgi:hypothetical protein
MKHGGKIGTEVTMQGRHIEEVKHMRVCVTKRKKIDGSPRISIGNGWKEFKTTNELKLGDHLSLKIVVIVKICNEFFHFEGCEVEG